MQRETAHPKAIASARGTLYLNGTPVGTVKVQRSATSWTYGEFEPHDLFGKFAPAFGRWSLLMHEDEEQPLSGAAASELRDAELAMDQIRGRIYFADDDAWHEVAQLNIDGRLIEWKEV